MKYCDEISKILHTGMRTGTPSHFAQDDTASLVVKFPSHFHNRSQALYHDVWSKATTHISQFDG